MKNYWSEIRQQLLTGAHWTEPNDRFTYEGLERQLQSVNPDERQQMVLACKILLRDVELDVRSGIVAILPEIAADLGANWLAKEWDEASGLFEDITPEGLVLQHSTLDKQILAAIAQVVQPEDHEAISLLRQTLQADPEWGTWLIPALARCDGEWLIKHADLIPHQMVSVLLPLSPSQRRELITQLAPWPPEILDNLEDYWLQFEPEEAQALEVLMRGH